MIRNTKMNNKFQLQGFGAVYSFGCQNWDRTYYNDDNIKVTEQTVLFGFVAQINGNWLILYRTTKQLENKLTMVKE